MTITRTFNLCLNKGNGVVPHINISQYDEEVWKFKLYTENGQRFIPVTGSIIGVKADGRLIDKTGTVDSAGQVVINVNQQMTAAAGKAEFELLIENQTHGTANFVVDVEQRAGENAIPSESDLSLLQEAVNSSQEILDIIGDTDLEEVVKDDIDAWLDAHPEATTTVEDGAITIAKLNDEVKTGVFEDMTVGTSLSVWNDEGVTDNLAYKFRPTGADAVREADTIVGGTIAWNQLVENGNFATDTVWTNESGTTHTVSNGTITINTTVNNNGIRQNGLAVYKDHKYIISLEGKCDTSVRVGCGTSSNYGVIIEAVLSSSWTRFAGVVSCTATNESTPIYIFGRNTTLTNAQVRNVMLIDLTQMFGSTIADYLYNLEQATAGAGVAWFKKLFPNSYYAYNSGELVSVEGLSAHETVGFNQWDEEWEVGSISSTTGENTSTTSIIRTKNYIPIVPSTVYYNCVGSMSDNTNLKTRFYDADKNYIGYNDAGNLSVLINKTFTTPQNAYYLRFEAPSGYGNAYKNDICINFSSSENGTYKPYQKHTYSLDSTLTLRGVPKWSNGLYFDGDIYRHDGSVQRKCGIVDLGTLNYTTWGNNDSRDVFTPSSDIDIAPTTSSDKTIPAICPKFSAKSYNATWSHWDMAYLNNGRKIGFIVPKSAYDRNTFKTAMSGVYLVYELATSTSETADPYQQYQICDGKGTEEYISETVTPVGHNTFYPVDIVAKVNKLPSDFSTLIAPTEKTFTATRNYTVNDLLIINNVLYKVTANIANGGTITVNTNVQQTTLGALIKALS